MAYNRNPRIPDRRGFIGGSDARIIMSNDESALVRLWREKRGEADPPDLSSCELSGGCPFGPNRER
jgi:predicted phage-related endonuclease